MTKQFFKFLFTGGIAAGVNLTSRYLLNMITSFEVSVVIAYLLGMITAYILARIFVFEASGRSISSEIKRFSIVNLFALLIVWGISVSLARIVFPAMSFTWHANDIAHIIGVIVPAITSFIGHSKFTFKKK